MRSDPSLVDSCPINSTASPPCSSAAEIYEHRHPAFHDPAALESHQEIELDPVFGGNDICHPAPPHDVYAVIQGRILLHVGVGEIIIEIGKIRGG
jgi:mannose-6-phosphate isomerase-like protein (cupin superfamily)